MLKSVSIMKCVVIMMLTHYCCCRPKCIFRVINCLLLVISFAGNYFTTIIIDVLVCTSQQCEPSNQNTLIKFDYLNILINHNLPAVNTFHSFEVIKLLKNNNAVVRIDFDIYFDLHWSLSRMNETK